MIYGETTSCKKITLKNVFEISNSNYNGQNVHEVYGVKHAYVVHHFSLEKGIKFKEMTVKLSHLDAGVNSGGFTSDVTFTPFTINVKYCRPPPKNIELSDGLKLQFGCSVKGPGRNAVQTKMRIAKSDFVSIEFKNEMPSEHFLSVVRKLKDLLTLAFCEPVGITSISARTKECLYPHRPDFAPITILGAGIDSTSQVKTRCPRDATFTLSDLSSDDFESLKKWFNIYEKLDFSLGLYFGQFYNKGSYAENKFLNLVFALEGFHRAMFDGLYLDKDEYEKTVYDTVLEILGNVSNSDLRAALKSRLKYGNEYSLRKRLNLLITDLKCVCNCDFLELVPDFVNDVVNGRNYLVHQPLEDSHSTPLTYHQLLRYSLTLSLVFELLILNLLGFKKELLNKVITKRAREIKLSKIL